MEYHSTKKETTIDIQKAWVNLKEKIILSKRTRHKEDILHEFALYEILKKVN